MSAAEKAAWHGHRPGIFLLPNRASLTDTVERALFKNGFAAITIEGEQISSAYLPSLLTSVWSAGLIVLLVLDKPSAQLVDALERVARDSLFNLGLDSDRKNREKIVAHILSRAETLRIGSPFDQTEKESSNA